MENCISLYFSDYDSPSLEQVEFYHPLAKKKFHSVRGKTSGAYETTRTFQWTNAVQAMSILFLRAALYNRTRLTQPASIPPTLEGEKGSIVASLDYALDKQPVWLTDMFGINRDGKSYLKNLITRNNPGLRRSRSIRIGLKAERFEGDGIKVYWNETEPLDEIKMLRLLRALEKSTGTMSAEELTQPQNVDSIEEAKSSTISAFATPQPTTDTSHNRSSPHTALFKTPFLKQRIFGGDAYVRCYEQGHDTALVVTFRPYESLNRQRRIPIRIHSSCSSSEALNAIDCDCKSQLDSAISLLRHEAGILVYMQQEGRGAGLYSKYRGMSISAHLGVDSYEAYKQMNLEADLRKYDLAKLILQDLGIDQIELLTNNPTKLGGLHDLNIDVSIRPCLGKLVPQNVSYLYFKMLNGEHKIDQLFQTHDGTFYLLESPSLPQNYERVWILSGDDTLWEDNIVYEDIIRLFIDHVCRHVIFPRGQARQYLDETETRVIPKLGYGPIGFLASLRETLERIRNETNTLIPEPSELFETVVPRLNTIGANISFKTVDVLNKIRAEGAGLVLFTQGPVDVQLRKIALSKLGEFFDAIAIVPEKNAEALQQLINDLAFKGQKYFIVGNNLKTDIVPATKLGLHAIYFNNPNSWQLLNRSDFRSDNYSEINSLTELLTI